MSNDYFDLVICTQVLEHVDNLEVTLGEIRRVLKSDGEAVIMVPFIYNAHGLPNDYRRYTMQGAIRLMSGFNVVKCHGQGGIGSTLAILLLNWIGVQKATSYIGRVIFTCLLPLWIPFCLLINTIARILDMLDTTSMFYNNVCLVVRKKADQNP